MLRKVFASTMARNSRKGSVEWNLAQPYLPQNLQCKPLLFLPAIEYSDDEVDYFA
jgi:hypothetical protein